MWHLACILLQRKASRVVPRLFISFMTPEDIFKALAVDIEATASDSEADHVL